MQITNQEQDLVSFKREQMEKKFKIMRELKLAICKCTLNFSPRK